MSEEISFPKTGHRQRLLQRFSDNGIEGFLNYEILELLLSFALPRRDVKPIAKELIRHYGSVGAVISADPGELAVFSGLGERSTLLFPLIREVAAHCLLEKSFTANTLSDRRAIENYLRFHFGNRKEEFVIAMFLGAGNVLIGVKELGAGTVNQCAIYPRMVMEYALRLKAVGIIIAHNHPSGIASPSEADWKVTDRLHKAGIILEIPLHDHLIIVPNSIQSLRELPRWPSK